ncbi:protocadherin Fat 4-like [Gigantopelta aegis]|uniref:protocadherin Fat 4-like n=1 Tax=Gigantopelta aegis TaxID=1735272 RepID=UPI001B88B9C6|nr:protocadherin Fat 4-like [Gigantopelta aegis]
MADGVDVFTLTISVEDSPDTGSALSTAVLVIVTIVPKNEFTPVWESPAFVNESFPPVVLRETVLPATEVTVFSATDRDRGADGVIQYTIESIKEHFKDTKVKDAKDMFLMISSSGALMTAKGLDADTGITHYEIVVAAVDSGTVQRTASGTIIVNIQDENDAASGSSSDSAELWAMRVLVGLLATGLLLVALLLMKTILSAAATVPIRPPIKKVVPKVQLERPEASDSHFKKGHIGYEISDYDDDLYL